MEATALVANRQGEVIIFRSTGPWAKRWLERGYPSKNFHVKGKSSDWGPHAGLVPFNGVYSKVGYDPGKAEKGTKANIEGLHSGFAAKETLVLTADQIEEQINRPEARLSSRPRCPTAKTCCCWHVVVATSSAFCFVPSAGTTTSISTFIPKPATSPPIPSRCWIPTPRARNRNPSK